MNDYTTEDYLDVIEALNVAIDSVKRNNLYLIDRDVWWLRRAIDMVIELRESKDVS